MVVVESETLHCVLLYIICSITFVTMPKRRRTTFTPKKKATRTYKTTGGDPDAPTEAEWSTLVEFGSFVGQSVSTP